MEDAIYDSQALCNFMDIDLCQQSVPFATTLMGFRHLLEANDLPQAMLIEVGSPRFVLFLHRCGQLIRGVRNKRP